METLRVSAQGRQPRGVGACCSPEQGKGLAERGAKEEPNTSDMPVRVTNNQTREGSPTVAKAGAEREIVLIRRRTAGASRSEATDTRTCDCLHETVRARQYTNGEKRDWHTVPTGFWRQGWHGCPAAN